MEFYTYWAMTISTTEEKKGMWQEQRLLLAQMGITWINSLEMKAKMQTNQNLREAFRNAFHGLRFVCILSTQCQDPLLIT
jgi:hypothetical protein